MYSTRGSFGNGNCDPFSLIFEPRSALCYVNYILILMPLTQPIFCCHVRPCKFPTSVSSSLFPLRVSPLPRRRAPTPRTTITPSPPNRTTTPTLARPRLALSIFLRRRASRSTRAITPPASRRASTPAHTRTRTPPPLRRRTPRQRVTWAATAALRWRRTRPARRSAGGVVAFARRRGTGSGSRVRVRAGASFACDALAIWCGAARVAPSSG